MYRLTAEDRLLRRKMQEDAQGSTVQTLAHALGMNDHTLYASIAPDTADEDRKSLTVERWRLLLQLTRRFVSLHEFCRTLGFLLIPIPARGKPAEDPLRSLAEIAKEMGDASGKLVAAMDRQSERGSQISANEAAAVSKELLDLMASASVLCQQVCAAGGISPERGR